VATLAIRASTVDGQVLAHARYEVLAVVQGKRRPMLVIAPLRPLCAHQPPSRGTCCDVPVNIDKVT
jgi:hypothetical protein